MTTLVAPQYFDFEADFVEDNIRCIPMIVRFKLDASCIKLKLAEWSKMNSDERDLLASLPCDTIEDISRYKQFLQQVVIFHTGQPASPLPPLVKPGWSVLSHIPEPVQARLEEMRRSITLRQWQRLSILQRFALMKLSSGGHEHKNFVKALEEFNLC